MDKQIKLFNLFLCIYNNILWIIITQFNTRVAELTSAPLANKFSTTSRWPSFDAKCSAFNPFLKYFIDNMRKIIFEIIHIISLLYCTHWYPCRNSGIRWLGPNFPPWQLVGNLHCLQPIKSIIFRINNRTNFKILKIKIKTIN